MATLVGLSLDQEIAHAFEDVCEVESVYVLRRENVIEVITVVIDDTAEVSDRIAEVELALGRMFRSVRFDFNTIARRGRPTQEFLGLCAPTWSRERCPQSPGDCGRNTLGSKDRLTIARSSSIDPITPLPIA